MESVPSKQPTQHHFSIKKITEADGAAQDVWRKNREI